MPAVLLWNRLQQRLPEKFPTIGVRHYSYTVPSLPIHHHECFESLILCTVAEHSRIAFQ
jgi:hypothetical protein